MRLRIGLLIVLAILVGIFLVIRLGFEEGGKERPLFPRFAPESAAKITVKGRERDAVLEKHGDEWLVVSEDSLPADPNAIAAIFDNVAGFSLKDIVSSNPEKQSVYHVDSTGISVSIEKADGTTMASFVVGKVGPDYQSTFVRDAASSDVILAPSYLPPVFEKGKGTWQDNKIFTIEPTEFTELRIRRPDQTIVLALGDAGEWFMSQPESAACDANGVSRIVRTLGYLRCEDFAGRTLLPEFGLDTPDSSVWFKTVSGSEGGVLFGNETESKQVYAKTAESDVVYLLAPYKVTAMLPKVGRLRKPEPAAKGE